MLLFELLTLSTPYRLEGIDPFRLGSHVAAGHRPVWPSYVAVAIPEESELRAADAKSGEELDADVSAAVSEANSVEYGIFLSLFEDCTQLAPKDRLTAKELVKRIAKMDSAIKERDALSLSKLRTRSSRA